MRICVFEDAGVANLHPLTQTRPAFDLLSGASSLLDRLKRFLAADDVSALVRPSLAGLCRATHAGIAVNDPARLRDGPVLLVNARWLPLGLKRPAFVQSEVGLHGDAVVYVYLQSPEIPDDLPAHLDAYLADWKRTL